MIVGRNPRTAVIGDTVLLRRDNRHGVGVIVDTDAIRYRVLAQWERPTFVARPPRGGRPPTRLRTAMAVTYLCLRVRMIAVFLEALEVRK